MWLELQLEGDIESRCLHLAASFASMASLQPEVNTCPDSQIDGFCCASEGVVVSFRGNVCTPVCVCGSDLGSGPGTWPRCVPASDRTPPSPGRGCHRNDRLRHTPGWSWCGNSRCCKHTCRASSHIRVGNVLAFDLLSMSRSKINDMNEVLMKVRASWFWETFVCVCV